MSYELLALSLRLHPVAIGFGGGHLLHGWVGIVVFCVFLAFAITVIVFRRRRGGPGPQANWVPKSMRGRVNERYEEHGWQKPYDDDGNRNRDREDI